MVAAATTLPSLSAPDEALISRLFERETLHSLKDLFNTLKKDPIENAPPSTFKSLLDFCRWSQRDDIKPWLDFHEAQLTAAIRRRRIAKLELLADNAPNPIEARRANTTILRHLSNLGLGALRSSRRSSPSLREGAGGREPNHHSRTHQSHESHKSHLSHESDADSHESHPSHQSYSSYPSTGHADSHSPSHPLTVSPSPPQSIPPPDPTSPSAPPRTSPPPLTINQAFAHKPTDIESPPTPLPDPTRTPQDLLDLALLAIQHPNNPERNTGPFTLFNLKGIIHSRTPADFAEFRGNYLKNMVGPSWEFLSHTQRWLKLDTDPARPHEKTPTRAYALIDLTLKDNSRRLFHLSLRRETQGVLKDCWLLGHFIIAKILIKSFYPTDLHHDTS